MPASTLGGPASEFLSILQWRSALEQAKDRGESVDQLRDASTAPSLATPASSNAPASLLRPAQPRKYHFDFPRPGGITERFSVAGSNSPSVAGVSQSPVPAPPAYERVPTPIAKPASARTVHAQAEAHAAPADDEDDERDNDILPPKRRRKSDSVVELLDSDSDDDVVVVRQQSQPHAGRASDEGEANNGGGGGKQHHAASGSRYARAAPARPRQRARVTQGAASRAAASGPSNRVVRPAPLVDDAGC
jgi:hypothetical protein